MERVVACSFFTSFWQVLQFGETACIFSFTLHSHTVLGLGFLWLVYICTCFSFFRRVSLPLLSLVVQFLGCIHYLPSPSLRTLDVIAGNYPWYLLLFVCLDWHLILFNLGLESVDWLLWINSLSVGLGKLAFVIWYSLLAKLKCIGLVGTSISNLYYWFCQYFRLLCMFCDHYCLYKLFCGIRSIKWFTSEVWVRIFDQVWYTGTIMGMSTGTVVWTLAQSKAQSLAQFLAGYTNYTALGSWARWTFIWHHLQVPWHTELETFCAICFCIWRWAYEIF